MGYETALVIMGVCLVVLTHLHFWITKQWDKSIRERLKLMDERSEILDERSRLLDERAAELRAAELEARDE